MTADMLKGRRRRGLKHLQRAAGSVCIHMLTCLPLFAAVEKQGDASWRGEELNCEGLFERRAPASRPRAPQSVHVLYVFISSHGYQLGLCRSTSSLHSCPSPPLPSALTSPPLLFSILLSLSKSISDISGWSVKCNPPPIFPAETPPVIASVL